MCAKALKGKYEKSYFVTDIISERDGEMKQALGYLGAAHLSHPKGSIISKY
jgi:hypothetical protein